MMTVLYLVLFLFFLWFFIRAGRREAPEEITLRIACIRCDEIFERAVNPRAVQRLAGVCESCMRYGR